MNKILVCGLAMGMAVATTNVAQAEKDTSRGNSVIFRIENIEAIEDKEGVVTQCEFVLTAYNRMEKGIQEAVINLYFPDNIEDKYKIVGNEIKVDQNQNNAKPGVTTSVEIRDLAPHQQKSFKEVVNTDKCFLLLDQLEYSVSTCLAEGEMMEFRNNKRVNKGSCTEVFDYINSQNPEYYSEFKDVPDSEMQKILSSQSKEDMQIIEDMYKSSLDAIQKANEKLDKIK